MAYTYNAGTTTANLGGLAEFNGVRINDGTFEMHHLGGIIDSAPVRSAVSPLPSDDGAFSGAVFLDPLAISLEGKLLVGDYTQVGPALDQLRGAFNAKAGSLTLRLNYPGWATARQVTAFVSGSVAVDEPADLEKLVPERNFVIPLTAVDPLLYDGDNLRTLDVPMTGVNTAVTNAGTAPTYMLASFNGPWTTSATLTHVASGNQIVYTGTVAAGALIQVQTNPTVGLSVTSNGGVNAYSAISTWTLYTIPPGTSNFTASAPSGTTAASKVTLQWRDAWY